MSGDRSQDGTSRTGRPATAIVVAAAAVVLLAAAGSVFALQRLAQATAAQTGKRGASGILTSASAASRTTTAPTLAGTAPAMKVAPPAVPVDAKPKRPPAQVPKVKAAAVATDPSAVAYRGLGAWVDIFDDRAWRDPSATVRDLSKHGVKTLYLETANSRSSFSVKDTAKTSAFIRASHAHGIRVVAWYLPDMQNLTLDYARVAQAIRLKTPDGQRFDSFALDIESSKVASVGARNRALTTLSTKIRKLVGRKYALGAIIPAPAAIGRPGSSWNGFPYAMVASTYDAFVPMSYYTYHKRGYANVYADTLANVRVLRAQKGCARIPIHLIGGISEESSGAELQAFLRAARETHSSGASIYAWSGTSAGQWKLLTSVKP